MRAILAIFGKAILSATKVALVMGVAGVGYFFGTWEKDRLLIEAEEAAYQKGKDETNSGLSIIHQGELEEARRIARQEGYSAGSQDQVNLNTNLNAQTEIIAKLIGYMQAPEALAAFPDDLNAAVEEAKRAVERKDFEAAGELLPPEISASSDSQCVEPKGLYTVSIDQRFTVCSTGQVFIVTHISEFTVKLSIDGDTTFVRYADRERFSENCFVAYERKFPDQNYQTAEVRLGCS